MSASSTVSNQNYVCSVTTFVINPIKYCSNDENVHALIGHQKLRMKAESMFQSHQ